MCDWNFYIENSNLVNFTIQNGNNEYGGGIYCINSSPFLQNLIIKNNISSDGGGGIFCNNSSPTMKDLWINSNTSNDVGGGIYLQNFSNPYCTNIFIYNNSSIYSGGGFYIIENSDPYIDHATVVNNVTDTWGGGLAGKYGVNIKISNSIIWANSPNQLAMSEYDDTGNVFTIFATNVQDGLNNIQTGNNDEINWLPYNMNTDPLFLDNVLHDFIHYFYMICRWCLDDCFI